MIPSHHLFPTAEWRAVLRLALPLIAGSVAQMMLTTTDIFLIARLGGEQLAAAALAASFYQTMWVFCGGLVMATLPLFAAARGQGSGPEELRAVIGSGLYTAVLIGVPAWALLGETPAILRFLGQSPELAAGAGEMMATLRWAILPYLVYILFRGTLAAAGRAGWTLAVILATVLFNALAAWTLIFGHFGLPALGLRGAGLASALSSIVLAGGTALVTGRHPALRALRLLAIPLRPDPARLLHIWRLGAPMAVLAGCEMGIFYAAMLMVGAVDPKVLPAHSVAMQIASICFMLPFGFAQAATVRVGFSFGAKDPDHARRAANAARLLGIGCAAATSLAMLAIPYRLLNLFLKPETMAVVGDTGAVMLRIAAFFLLSSAAQTIATGALRGLQDTRTPMLIATLGYWGIGMPAAAFLGFRAGWGGAGIWTGLTFGIVAVALLMNWRWQRHLRRFAQAS